MADYRYWCSYCDQMVAGQMVLAKAQRNKRDTRWLRCDECGKGSEVTSGNVVIPGAKPGQPIKGLPADVAAAYEEARRCLVIDAATACELICRKLIARVAVSRGGVPEGATFSECLVRLEDGELLPPSMREWAGLLRTHAAEGDGELPAADRDRAEGAFAFTAELLRLVYEIDHLARKFARAVGESPAGDFDTDDAPDDLDEFARGLRALTVDESDPSRNN